MRVALEATPLAANPFRLALEADSFEFHTVRKAHARDRVRYIALTVAGWRVLRFTWDQVMVSPGYVWAVLADVLLGDMAARAVYRDHRKRSRDGGQRRLGR